MLTKTEVAAQYTLDDRGLITQPGKFEREPWWVVALWELALDGCTDLEVYDGETPVSCFTIDDELAVIMERDALDLERDRQYSRSVCLYESESGFVTYMVLTARQIDALEGGE